MSPPPQPPENPEARQRQSEALARTNALLLSEDFSYFLRECVQAEIDAAAKRAVSTQSNDRERDQAAHVHDAMLRVKEWAQVTHNEARCAIGS
jgi:hypothetical protein